MIIKILEQSQSALMSPAAVLSIATAREITAAAAGGPTSSLSLTVTSELLVQMVIKILEQPQNATWLSFIIQMLSAVHSGGVWGPHC